MQIPSWRLFEDVICHHYYDNMTGAAHIGLKWKIDERMCKGEEVQEELNTLVAGQVFLAAIPSR